MIEFIGGPLVLASMGLLLKNNKLSDKKKVEHVFYSAGMAAMGKDKKPHFPKLQKKVRFPKDKSKPLISMTFLYKLPIGLPFKKVEGVVEFYLMDALAKGVIVEQPSHGYMSVKVFERPLPPKVEFHPMMLQMCKNGKVLIGVTQESPIFHDFEMYQHLGVAGMTRYGKSVFLNLLITTLAVTMKDKAKLHLFDLKGGVTFNKFSTLEQCVPFKDKGKEYRFVTRKDHARTALQQIERRVRKREMYFRQNDWENTDEAKEDGVDLGREFIIIDEAAVLAPRDKSDKVGKDCQKLLEYIAQVGGGLGFSLVMCMQYPVSDVFPRQIKQNTVSQLSFKVRNETASKVIIDEHGAEELPVKNNIYKGGRAIYKTDRKQTIQVPFIEKSMVYELIEPFKLGEPEEIDEKEIDEYEYDESYPDEDETYRVDPDFT